MNSSNITHKFNNDFCELIISIPKTTENIHNCDAFLDEHNFILVVNAHIERFHTQRRFITVNVENFKLSFNTKQWEFSCSLPCHPESPKEEILEISAENTPPKTPEQTGINYKDLNRITDNCLLTVDGKICNIESDFSYGFAGRFRGKPKYHEDDLSRICRITSPHLLSSIQRTIKRERDEDKDFCRGQYKLHFVELPIPEGHDNPLRYTIPYDDTKLSQEEELILKKIESKEMVISNIESEQTDIDCGLISILLAITYDVRLTSNEPTCESSWTRSILSSALSYFERFENLTLVVESFLRRALVYPLYRNYDLSRICVGDLVEALQKGKPWILKQLLVTYSCFKTSNYNRKPFNKFFIKDYIWYVSKILTNDHLQILSRNLKNVLFDINKKQLRLNLGEIETELLRELIEDVHLSTSSESEGEVLSSSEGVSSTDDDSESDESETDDSSDSDRGSVIEKKI